MKILLTGRTMTYLSGQPLYVYTLAQELVKEHDVSVLSVWTDNELKNKLIESGVKCIICPEQEYDLIIASEFKPDNVKGYTINIVHSEYDCETPISDCDFYVGIRPSIVEHIIKEHNIPKNKTKVVYNGIDRNRFKKSNKIKRPFKLTVVPCTIDKLREKFLNHLIDTATKKNMYLIVGSYFGAELHNSPFVAFLPPTFNIEKYIEQADEVAGILLGRVNLEANSMGIKSLIYDPITLKRTKFMLDEKTFDKRHNIKKVAKQILKIYENK